MKKELLEVKLEIEGKYSDLKKRLDMELMVACGAVCFARDGVEQVSLDEMKFREKRYNMLKEIAKGHIDVTPYDDRIKQASLEEAV
jgi:hypothetical protein